MDEKTLEEFRYFLKDTVRQTVDFTQTDQSRGVPPPPLEKPLAPDTQRIALPGPDDWRHVKAVELVDTMRARESCRRFSDEPVRLDELAFLLWATQGIRRALSVGTALRNVPSAGARHPLETYLCVMNVAGLQPGIFRYLALEHQLAVIRPDAHLLRELTAATLGQAFAGRAAVTFVWTAVPYRMEWRYGLAAHKVIALDAGHVCQNLYLACRAIGAGTCAIAAYDQSAMDRLLEVDGKEEFTVYLAPVGKV
jgi:SagB-type dehydrogenase family enzyme